MEKKEKKSDLEGLLNSLIEKGWKPRGLLNEVEYIKAFKDTMQGWRVEISYEDHGYYKSIREILSKESGLWQFVCENGMARKIWNGSTWEHNTGDNEEFNRRDYQYRLIESALCDEDKLEEFLLQNIKINDAND